MRAVIDIGSNSVRLLVAEIAEHQIIDRTRDLRITRLGEGVDCLGKLSPEGIKRTMLALQELINLIPPNISLDVLATSAVRDASNRAELLNLVREAFNLDVHVLSGINEAELSFQGAIRSVQGLKLPAPYTVVDIGGGSTEIYTGLPDGSILGGASLQVGAVRMLERHITTHPILASEKNTLECDIEKNLLPLIKESLSFEPQTLIAVGGTATSLAAIAQELANFKLEKIRGFSLSVTKLREIYNNLGKLNLAERSHVKGLQKGREDIIVAGAAILIKIAEMMSLSRLTTTTEDLLYGWLHFVVDEG